MKIFITGVAGFLGSHLADWFIERGHTVAGCDNMFGGEMINVPAGVEFHHHDITVLDGYAKIMAGADVVYHCAAAAYEGVSVFAPGFIADNIFTGSAVTFSAAIKAGVKRIVNCSSMARFGAGIPPFREDDKPIPQDPYGIAKLGAEHVLRNLAITHGFEYAIAVPHNIYGPRQRYCMSAGSMVKLSTGFKPIEAVRAGDHVLIGGTTAPVVDQFPLGVRRARQIRLVTGQVITVGQEHRFRTLDKDMLVWKQARELAPGDCILSENEIGAQVDRKSRDFRYGQFLGLLIADGTYNDPYEISVACCIEDDKPDLRALLSDLNISFVENARGVFRIGGKKIVDQLRSIGMQATGPDKIIPECVLAMSHETVAGVISGLFSGDGWVVRNQNVVGFASVSEKLVSQVQRILLAYGLKSTVRRREPKPGRLIEGRLINSGPIWQLVMLSENASRFGKIGFIYGRKQALVEGKEGLKESATISGLGAYLAQIGPLLPLPVRIRKPNALNCPRNGVSRYSLRQLVNLIDEWLVSPGADVSETYTAFIREHRNRWYALAHSGHFVSIERVDDVECELFDISVDAEHHSYIGDGFVSHNCDPYRNVASIMANLMLQGRPPVIYGDGEQKRCFSYITDTVGCLGAMATSDDVVGEVINIGPDEEFVTINDLAERLANVIGFNQPPIYMPGRPQEVKHATCSADKARKLLGYETKVFLDDGLKLLVEGIKERGPRPFEYHFDVEFVTPKTPKTWTDRLF